MRLYKFLTEEIFKGEYYLMLRNPIEQTVNPSKFFDSLYDEKGEFTVSVAGIIVNSTNLTRYKRLIGTAAATNPTYNYIYAIKDIRAIQCNIERDVKMAVNNGSIGRDFSGEKGKKLSADKRFEGIKSYCLVGPKFQKNYDGLYGKFTDEITLALTPSMVKKFTLVDGNMKRFVKDTDGDFTLPDGVEKELQRYTENAGKKMRADVKEGLIKNTPKPYSTKRIYRGVGTQFDDYGDWSKVTIDMVNKRVKKYFGKSLTEIGKGSKIEVKRGKESSWSTTPQISNEFARSLAEKSINVLVGTEIPASKVIIDFTELPKKLKDKFKFSGQNEVIVDTEAIPATVSMIGCDKKFVEGLKTKGYKFNATSGITPE